MSRPSGLASTPRPSPRRLPAVALPLAEEAFFSWVDHLAYSYQVGRVAMMHALGVGPRGKESAARDLIRYTMRLPADASRAVGDATGLTDLELSAMTLWHLGPPYAEVNPSRMPKSTWAFCPKCLVPEGRWPLWWYEPWAAACPVHRCYLIPCCPHCNTPFTPERTSSQWGASRQCRGFRDAFARRHPPGPPRKPCGTNLWEIPAEPVGDPVVLKVIEHLRHALTPSTPPSQWLGSYRVLNALFNLQAVKVRSFTSADPILQSRFRPLTLPPGYVVGPSRFVERGYTTVDRLAHTLRDPTARACKLSVIGQILGSDDMTATARDLLEVPVRMRMVEYRRWGPLAPDLALASRDLYGFLEDVFVPGAFAAFQRSRRTLPPPAEHSTSDRGEPQGAPPG